MIAAIYLLHEWSVNDVASKLRPDELAHVIRLVGRCPSCYPPGTFDALRRKRAPPVTPPTESFLPNATAKEDSAHHPQYGRPSPRNATPKPNGVSGATGVGKGHQAPGPTADGRAQLEMRETPHIFQAARASSLRSTSILFV